MNEEFEKDMVRYDELANSGPAIANGNPESIYDVALEVVMIANGSYADPPSDRIHRLVEALRLRLKHWESRKVCSHVTSQIFSNATKQIVLIALIIYEEQYHPTYVEDKE